jgi:hypothetical protein
LKRRVLRIGAILGAATVTTLAIAPAFAAAATSQATAQSLEVSIAGNTAVSQKVTATNDGSGETKNNANTLPSIANVLPNTNLLGVGVAPQDAGANSDGTSFACAGIAGQGSDGAVVNVGHSACDIDGSPITLDLADLDLGNVVLGDSAIGDALNGIPGLAGILQTLGVNLTTLVGQISDALAPTPLGEITIGGSLSAIEGQCTANPDSAQGDTHLVDTSGGSNQTPISVTLPGVQGPIVVANLPANPPPNTHVLVNLDTVTQTLVTALTTEIETALQGQLANAGLGAALQTIQDQLLVPLVAQLQPLLQPLQDDVLDITLNKQSTGDGGRSIDLTALDLQVLPAAQEFIGSSLISGLLGHVTCGPNTRATTDTGGDTGGPGDDGDLPDIPTVVDSGLAGHQDHTARDVLGATAALMLLAGTAGLLGYRRMLNK